MENEMLAMLTQFGTAGLIAWMWLTERRHATQREKQLTEAHDQLTEQRVQLGQLLRVVEDNTRAVASLDAGQRRLLEALDRLSAPTSPISESVKTPRDQAA